MDKVEGLVIALLVFAIIFSAASIFISLSAINLDIPNSHLLGEVVAGDTDGGVNLYVESPLGDTGS